MATEEQGGQGADTVEETSQQQTAEEGGQQQQQEAEGSEGASESPEIEGLAQRMGWVPRDQYSGPAEQWKPASQYILDGRDIQRETSRELRGLRERMDTITRTTGTLIEQQVAERVAQLQERHAELVEAGDTAGALRVAEEITRAKTIPANVQQPNGPSPAVQDFMQRNASWFNQPGNEYATARARTICAELAAQGYSDHGQQLAIAEQRLRQEFPQLGVGGSVNGFSRQQKAAPRVLTPGQRGTTNSGSRDKGFADLPKEAQDIALDLEGRLGVPKESYAKNYFAEQAKRA